MDTFLNQVAEKTAEYRHMLQSRGFPEDRLTEKTQQHLKMMTMRYYAHLMEFMSEDDYQAYKQALYREDVPAFQAVLQKYAPQVADLQKAFLTSFLHEE